LYSKGLLTRGELEKISAMTDDDASERLLIYILPKKGPQAFDIFLKTLRETEGQSYIAEELLNPESHGIDTHTYIYIYVILLQL
jgi:hypothetical protein